MALFYVERPSIEPVGDFSAVIAVLPQDFSRENIEESIRQLADDHDVKLKNVVAPIRLAVTGSKISPPLFEAMELLGRDEVIVRLVGASSKIA